MSGRNRFTVSLYTPCTETACDALARYLQAAGLKTSIDLPDPAPASKLRYGVLPFASFRLALRNGKVPSRELVDAAVHEAYEKLRTKFGEAALDLNGTLIGSISERR